MKICQNRFEVQARGSLEHQARWRRHWKRLKGTTGKFGGGGRSAAQFAPAQKKIQTCKSVRAAADEMCGVSIFLKAGSGSPPGEANTRGQAPPPDFHAISNKRALWLLLSAGGLSVHLVLNHPAPPLPAPRGHMGPGVTPGGSPRGGNRISGAKTRAGGLLGPPTALLHRAATARYHALWYAQLRYQVHFRLS